MSAIPIRREPTDNRAAGHDTENLPTYRHIPRSGSLAERDPISGQVIGSRYAPFATLNGRPRAAESCVQTLTAPRVELGGDNPLIVDVRGLL